MLSHTGTHTPFQAQTDTNTMQTYACFLSLSNTHTHTHTDTSVLCFSFDKTLGTNDLDVLHSPGGSQIGQTSNTAGGIISLLSPNFDLSLSSTQNESFITKRLPAQTVYQGVCVED